MTYGISHRRTYILVRIGSLGTYPAQNGLLCARSDTLLSDTRMVPSGPSGPSVWADSRGTIGTTRRYQQEWQGSPSPTGPEGTTWFPMGTTRFPMGTVSVPICPNTGYLTSSLYRLFQSPSCYKHPTFSGCPSHVVTIGEPIAPWIQ